jgi:hypothetical protein
LLSEVGAVARDPEARALIQSLRETQLRQQGAMVLAPGLPLYGP